MFCLWNTLLSYQNSTCIMKDLQNVPMHNIGIWPWNMKFTKGHSITSAKGVLGGGVIAKNVYTNFRVPSGLF